MHRKIILALFLLCCCGAAGSAADVFKYKDQEGNWIFTDKVPADSEPLEKVTTAQTQVPLPAPRIYTEKLAGRFFLFAENTIHGPVQIEVLSPTGDFKKIERVLAAKESITLYEGAHEIKDYKLRWSLGDPDTTVTDYLYDVPIRSKQKYTISQGFNGRFSHFHPASRYAIDIMMESGTFVSAARAGVIMWVKEDSYVGGAKASFMNKANFIAVLHDDGSYAMYLHLLGGSSVVRAGDTVKAGDRLAKSGASGYASGPHLHFVVQKNSGMRSVSIPFEFKSESGSGITPKVNMKVSGKYEAFGSDADTNLNPPTRKTAPAQKHGNEKTSLKLKAQCESARTKYIILTQKAPAYRTNKNQLRVQSVLDFYQGKRMFLGDTERAREIENTKLEIVEVCQQPNDEAAFRRAGETWLRSEYCGKLRYDVALAKDPKSRTTDDVIKQKQETARQMCSGETPLPK